MYGWSSRNVNHTYHCVWSRAQGQAARPPSTRSPLSLSLSNKSGKHRQHTGQGKGAATVENGVPANTQQNDVMQMQREFRKRVYRVRAAVACSRVPHDDDPRKAVFGGATGVTEWPSTSHRPSIALQRAPRLHCNACFQRREWPVSGWLWRSDQWSAVGSHTHSTLQPEPHCWLLRQKNKGPSVSRPLQWPPHRRLVCWQLACIGWDVLAETVLFCLFRFQQNRLLHRSRSIIFLWLFWPRWSRTICIHYKL